MEKSDFGTDIDDPFGFCPRCLAEGDYSVRYDFRNVFYANFGCCEEHRCYWKIDWKYHLDVHGGEEYWDSNKAVLATMTQVEPGHLPKTELDRRLAERDRGRQRVIELHDHLNNECQELAIRLLCELAEADITEGRVRRKLLDRLPPLTRPA